LFVRLFYILFILQEKQLGCETIPIELYEETHIRKEIKGKIVKTFIDSKANSFVVSCIVIFFN
jgi:hypothetical protein